MNELYLALDFAERNLTSSAASGKQMDFIGEKGVRTVKEVQKVQHGKGKGSP